MNRHLGPYHCAAPAQKPANSNSNEDEPDRTGQYEYWCRSAIRDLVAVRGDDAVGLVETYLRDAFERSQA